MVNNKVNTPRSGSNESQKRRRLQQIKDGGHGVLATTRTPKTKTLNENHHLMTHSDGKDFDRLTEIMDANLVKPGDHTFGKQNSKTSLHVNNDASAKGL